MGLRVLVVDDSGFMRKRVCEQLVSQGHSIAGEARGGNEAVQLFKTLKPDLVTMDITMRDKDGITAAREILQENPDAKILMNPCGDVTDPETWATQIVDVIDTLEKATGYEIHYTGIGNEPNQEQSRFAAPIPAQTVPAVIKALRAELDSRGFSDVKIIAPGPSNVDGYMWQAVESVVAWVEENSTWDETLIIVTGDHETGYLTGPGSGQQGGDVHEETRPVWNPLVAKDPGQLPGLEWNAEHHTNSLIPLYARGPGCDAFNEYVEETDPVRGPYVDNTAVARVMRRSIGYPVDH